MKISGAFLVVQTGGCYWHLVEARDAATHATTHRTLLNNYLAQNGNVAEVEKPSLIG